VGSPSVSEKSEVADAHKAARQQVQEEAAQELIDGQSHQPLLVGVSRVSPMEGNVALGQSHQPVVEATRPERMLDAGQKGLDRRN